MNETRISKVCKLILVGGVLGFALNAPMAQADSKKGDDNGRSVCKGLPDRATVLAALKDIVPDGAIGNGGPGNGGLNNNMWLTLVAVDGSVCQVMYTGASRDAQWLLSRVISAQKASTANGLSLSSGNGGTEIALSTANLNTAVNPGGSLYGLQHSNPVNAEDAYKGNSKHFGQHNDPLVGKKVGGVNVFGGGLALYDANKVRIGALGVSGDTSCTDHVVAWKVRDALGLDNVPGGVAASGDDAMVQDITVNPNGGTGVSATGWGHPTCVNNPTAAQDGGSIVGN